jgi:hypothetical protein
MIFGKTRLQRYEERQAELKEWYDGKKFKHFPILPVYLNDGRLAWFCPVWKRLDVVKQYGEYAVRCGCTWEYFEIEKE